MVKTTTFDRYEEILKVDEDLGLVFGWAIICKIDGEDYYDTQGDHIPEDAMIKAAADFMLHSRQAGEMHEKGADGKALDKGAIVFAAPMTADIAEAYSLPPPKITGLMVTMKPAQDMMAKFKAGTYEGLSIGGARITDEEVA